MNKIIIANTGTQSLDPDKICNEPRGTIFMLIAIDTIVVVEALKQDQVLHFGGFNVEPERPGKIGPYLCVTCNAN